ncbi:tannase and feruloyl esterase [Penicillium pulvis]|uniref:tannase and feruloyl esterase n=1 Tax=Penicillium pulvis TaxID=1562058 RepID=UPI002548091A|nr:tannase and feruloyl esterase [Penicillium pulvis]KAJ5785457.1 tannase and feruloyl esterase [Penicillium pulvis]
MSINQTDPGYYSAKDFNHATFYKREAKQGIGIGIDRFSRLFLTPGMQHYYDTSTTTNASRYITGPTQASALSLSLYSVPGYSDVKHDILLALVNWVENGLHLSTKSVLKFTETLAIEK